MRDVTQCGIAVQVLQAGVCINLEASTVRVGHQDKCRPVVRADIAVADVRPVTAEVDESEDLIV